MKIVHIGKYYSPVKGGIETYIRNIAENINVQQEIIVSNTCNKTKKEKVNNVSVKRLARICKIFSMDINLGLASAIKNAKTDIFHLHLPNPFAVISFLIVNPKGKVIITWHSDIIRQKLFLPIYLPFLNLLLRRVDKIIVTSSNYLNTSRVLRKYKKKCVIIPLGIDFNDFKKTKLIEKKAIKLRNKYGDKIILFVGRLVYYKGLEYLIKAVSDIDAVLLVIGKGPLASKLNSSSSQKVHFLGEVLDLKPYYHVADVFVLPSIERSEAFGIVQLEAIASMVPVVSTILGTGVEMVNKHGFLVKPRNVSQLTFAIKKALQADSSVTDLSYNYALSNFNIHKMNSRILDLYNNVYKS